MPVASLFRPQPQLLQSESIQTSVVKGAFKTIHSKPRRRVHFKESVSVRPITHVNNMSDDDIRNGWFTKGEFVQMKRSMAVTVKMLSAGIYQGDDDEHCARGLEYRTRVGNNKRKENKVNALDAVLDEQDRQHACGVLDDEGLRQVFLNTNLHCRLAALEKGVQDQEVARFLQLDSQDDEDDLVDESSSSDDDMDYCTTPDNMSLMKAPCSSRFASSRMAE